MSHQPDKGLIFFNGNKYFDNSSKDILFRNTCYETKKIEPVKKEESMNVTSFKIKESDVNKGLFVLIAKTEDGKEYVCSGDTYNPTYLTPIEQSFDLMTSTEQKLKSSL